MMKSLRFKLIVLYFLPGLLFWTCTAPENSVEKNEDLQVELNSKKDAESDEGFYPFLKTKNEYQLNQRARLFAEPKLNSESTLITIAEYFKIISQNDTWYKVRISINESGVIKDGFLPKSDIRLLGIYCGDMNSVYYDYAIGESDKKLLFYIKKYKEDGILDTLTVENMHHSHRILDIGNTYLKNGKYMISFQTFRESCPGLTSDDFILINKNYEFVELMNSISTGEAGYSEEEEIYLPVRFGNGTVKLVLNGDSKNMVDWQTGEILEIQNPKQYGIPLDELIIKKKINIEPVLDEKMMELADEDGEYMTSETKETLIYQWNGLELKLKKKIKE